MSWERRIVGRMMAVKRALILAGGGLKVAFQAGVLQVWLDEAKLQFDLYDGASGGCLNLAMLCGGSTGRQIADNWRATDPIVGVSVNALAFERLLFAPSLFTLDAYRRNVFPKWGLNFDAIRGSKLAAAFNVYNVTRQRLQTLSPAQMSEDALCATISLPMWFPPVKIDGELLIDSVFVTDANIEDALARGADEVWVIWTVSERGAWADGFVNHYFQMVESAANGRFKLACERIERNNAAIAAGGHSEFGRHIELKILRAEVPLNYLMNFGAARIAEAVNLGVARARTWCGEQGIAVTPQADPPAAPRRAAVSLRFDEEMSGYLTEGVADYDAGFRRGRLARTPAKVRLRIVIDDLDEFLVDPQHEATVEGTFECDAFGGRRPIEQGRFNLFVDDGDPSHKSMYYRLRFRDGEGRTRTLIGFKDVQDDPGVDEWSDTTTLFTRVLDGDVSPDGDGGATILAGGILRLSVADLLRELTTFRVEGGEPADRLAALPRFGQLFLGKMWDVYARHVLPVSPI